MKDVVRVFQSLELQLEGGIQKLEHMYDAKGTDFLLPIQKHNKPYNLLLKNSVNTLNN